MAESATKTKTGLEAAAGYRGYVLFILIVVYTFNFIDRQIIGILAVPIQQELGVSDTMMGVMRGLAFAIFYSTLGVPIAWLADRYNRVKIMAIALSLWSIMTMVCGLITTPVQLFFARMGVGVGEAGGVAPAYSIVSDYFPPEQRARALAVYSFGIPIGSAVGIVFGGVIATLLDWRAAFLIVGGLGVILAPIFWLTTREPERGQFDGGEKPKPVGVAPVLKKLVSKPSFWLLSLGAAFSSMMGYGLFAWIPTFLVRSFADGFPVLFSWAPTWLVPEGAPTLLYASYFYGAVVLTGGIVGIFTGGALADRLGGASKANYARIPAFAFLATAPFLILGTISDSLAVIFFVMLIPTALSLAWLGPVLAAFQHIVPPNMRATASAIFLLINNLVGLGLGDVFLGVMSDSFAAQFGSESLRYSIMSGGIFYLVAAGLLLLASRYLARDWEGEGETVPVPEAEPPTEAEPN
ncbi:MFS transporter [Maricaulis sp.]|uniref:spinster family MFS transporter n=1 Tax=Maricaulis sp. TaxID=1486257 RepID=UPI001B132329|nr:MFS transporter [Maricaulis sp.]MBO6764650.1 MFS transporter [Maricaulis sp.]